MFYLKLEKVPHRKSVHKPILARVRVSHVVGQFIVRDLIEIIPRDDTRTTHYLAPVGGGELRLLAMFLQITARRQGVAATD